jgi:hypothetical protein
MEQGLQPLHAERGVCRRRRAEIVIHERRIRYRHPGGRQVFLAQRRRALIAEAGEGERGATARSSVERAEFRVGAVVHRPVQIDEVGPQLIELGVIGVDQLAGLGIGVTMLFGIDGLLELAVEAAEHDTGISNRLQRVPGHHHLGRRIRAELQMQSGDRRRRHRIGQRG